MKLPTRPLRTWGQTIPWNKGKSAWPCYGLGRTRRGGTCRGAERLEIGGALHSRSGHADSDSDTERERAPAPGPGSVLAPLQPGTCTWFCRYFASRL